MVATRSIGWMTRSFWPPMDTGVGQGQAWSWLPGICRSDPYKCLPSEFTGETDIFNAHSQRKEEAMSSGAGPACWKGKATDGR